MAELRAAVLCGGSGTRLWPLSTPDAPKQFHPLVGQYSLLGDTLRRVARIERSGRSMIVTAEAHAETVIAHAAAAGVGDVDVILEPLPRNTAPAAALAALAAAEDDPETIVALFPSDHFIADEDGFLRAINFARELAEDGAIATLGITPQGPHTGYGYIRRADGWKAGFHVGKFVEKPDAATAQRFFADGTYYWNAGIFIFRADAYLRELAVHRPEIATAAQAAWRARSTAGDRQIVDTAAWRDCQSESIDQAVAEKTTLAAVVPADIGWSDVGSWSSLMDIASPGADGNIMIGDAAAIRSSGCYVRATSRHVSVIGASDLIVVETPDAVLVVHRDSTEHVKSAANAFGSTRPAKHIA